MTVTDDLIFKIAWEEAYSKGISRTDETGEWVWINQMQVHSSIIESVARRTGLSEDRIKRSLEDNGLAR